MRFLSGRIALVLLVIAGFAAVPLKAQNVLLFADTCGSAPDLYSTALSNLGLSATVVGDDAAFQTQMAGGPWDLVLVEVYGDSLSAESEGALAAYVAGGGRVALSTYDWRDSLANIFEADLLSTYDTPLNIETWTSHQLFTTPNSVPDPLVPATDGCSTDGGRFQPIGGGVAVGGYTGAPASNEAAVIVGNSGRTVLFGGILGLFGDDNDSDLKADGVEMAENIISYLLGVAPAATAAPVPTVTEWGLLALALGVALAGVRFLR
jgi:hypothetical protein